MIYIQITIRKQIKVDLPRFHTLFRHLVNGTLDCFMKEMKLQILQTYPQLYSLCCFICSQPWIKLWTYLNDESLQCGSILMAGLMVFVGNSGTFWKLCTQLLEHGIWIDNIIIKKNWNTVLLHVPENMRKWLSYEIVNIIRCLYICKLIYQIWIQCKPNLHGMFW